MKLVESAAVLALFGIMAGFAAPGVYRISREWTLWGAAHEVESSLLWGRMYAISANDSMIFIVDPGGGRFYWQDPEGNRYQTSIHDLPAGARITQSPHKPLRFYQHGNAAPAGTYVIQGDAGSYRVVVSVQGRIRIQRDS